MRDPYAIYARHILRLRPLDEAIDAEPEAAEFGTFVHAALAAFLNQRPRRLARDAL